MDCRLKQVMTHDNPIDLAIMKAYIAWRQIKVLLVKNTVEKELEHYPKFHQLKMQAYKKLNFQYDVYYCSFCEYSSSTNEVINCTQCPASNYWTGDPDHILSTTCMSKGAQYRHFIDTLDPEPMLAMMEQMIADNGIDINNYITEEGLNNGL